jgi:hypothetical protein
VTNHHVDQGRAPRVFGLLLAALATAGAGCEGDGPGGPRPPTADQIPEHVRIEGGPMEFGVALGKRRDTVQVEGFSIAVAPTTVGQYGDCVEAGACRKASLELDACARKTEVLVDRDTFSADAGDDLPATCLTRSQAAAYCKWVGGALPTAAQWLLGARGPEVHRYPWGGDAPSCDDHPRAVTSEAEGRGCCPDAACDPNELYAVGRGGGRALGAMGDALLTQGELLRPSRETPVPACQGELAGCLVSGSAPGAIDFFMPIQDEPADPDRTPIYGFRCVFEGKAVRP